MREAFACTTETCDSVTPPILTSDHPIFERGDIDLTGDGIPESVERDGATLIITEQGRQVWRSPEAWHVLDADLGDPNNDGRYEIMVAFWKDDADGTPRSHPFIVGYRGGHYREVWGGSPVSEPIYELALADIDGNGVQDLIVLDAASKDENGDLRTLSVWRWHGWGFSLMWRSEPRAYRDLVIHAEEGASPLIGASAMETASSGR